MTHFGRSAEVMVTGMGVATPGGSSIDDLWSSLRSGESTARRLSDERGEQTGYLGCRVRGLDIDSLLDAKELRRTDPFVHFAMGAGIEAFRNAGSPTVDPNRCAVIVGNGVGGRTRGDQEAGNYFLRGPGKVHPLMPIMTMPNAAAAKLSIALGWHGPALTVATTCASGADAIALGAALLRAGHVDVVLAGGSEATLTPVTLAAFLNLGAMSKRLEDPAAASRPFDADRDGFVMGEGAGFVVLERRGDAQARSQRTYAEFLGSASTSDAHHLTMPCPTGAYAMAAMANALRASGVVPADITHVNAHGTSTPLNDDVEATAIRKVFKTDQLPVTSNKGVLGHLIGAAGAVELVSTVLAMNACEVPPTANHDRRSVDMEIDVVHTQPRPIRSGPAISNSFGFGGHNTCLVIGPP